VSSAISDHARTFIREHIRSVEQLEVLLLLRRERTRLFTGEDAARELRVHPESASRWLEDLVARRLAIREGDRFQFYPQGPTSDRDVAALAAAYADARVGVIQLIFTKPPEAVLSFADAFKLRGKP
jgi:hypothetical protein